MSSDPGSASSLLAAYDQQLRGDAEMSGAGEVDRLGPLHLAVFSGGHGFISYRDLGEVDGSGIPALVDAALERFRAMSSVRTVEWKTRGHDAAPGLTHALTDAGFVAGPEESIMIGPAAALAVNVPLPDGVGLRRIAEPDDVLAMCRMADLAFEESEPGGEERAQSLIERLEHEADSGPEGMQLWIAEADTADSAPEGIVGTTGRLIVSCGRIEPVPGTDFAGVWGGATLQGWRSRGIYRALTSARARAAIAAGKRYINSDSTEYSRPILERYGFTRVSTTTPYELRLR